MKGCFCVYENPEDEFDIRCDIQNEVEEKDVPEEQWFLYQVTERAVTRIKSLVKTDAGVKKNYIAKVLSLTQAGLVGDSVHPVAACKSLEILKEEILLVEGQRIKNHYMYSLGLSALVLSVILLVVLRMGFLLQENCDISFFSQSAKYIYCIIGAFLGTWISFGARKSSITFEELSLLEKDMMTPVLRLIYIGACSFVVFLLLNTGIVSISFSEISSTSIKEEIELQLALGILCGLVESKIGIKIYNKAKEVLDSE